MRTHELNISEIKDKSIHSGLFEALCLLKQACVMVETVQDETEINKFKHRWVKLDDIHDELSAATGSLNELLSEIMAERLSDMVKGY